MKEISRLSRLTAIHTLLQSKQILTSSEISRKFNIGVRTAYRDIKALEQSGIPIQTIDGKGYSLMEGYTIPPLMFTEAEANSLITVEHLINQNQDESLIKNFQDVLTKVKSIFRYGMKESTEMLSGRIAVHQNGNAIKTSNSLSQIQMAITSLTLIKVTYQSVNNTKITSRTIEPFALYSSHANWILIAWCRLRRDYRAFRIDTVKEIEFIETKFESRNFDLRKYFATCPENKF